MPLPVVLAITAQKGGCAKTTTAQALAQAWCHDHALDKIKCLLVDADPQGNLTDVLGVDNPPQGVLDAIMGNNPGQHVISVSSMMDLLPAGESLLGADLALLRDTEAGSMTLLAKAIDTLAPAYQLVIIDTPPTLGSMTISALMAASHALIVSTPERLSLGAVSRAYDTIASVRQTHTIDIVGLLLTRVDARRRVDRALIESATATCANLEIPLIGGITANAAITEAQARRQALSPAITAMQDYITVYKRLKERVAL